PKKITTEKRRTRRKNRITLRVLRFFTVDFYSLSASQRDMFKYSEEKGGKIGLTIAEALKEAGERLRAGSVPNDLLDAQTLLAEALGKDRTYLIVNFNQRLSEGIL